MAEFLVFAENHIRLDVSLETLTALLKRGDITEGRPDGLVRLENSSSSLEGDAR